MEQIKFNPLSQIFAKTVANKVKELFSDAEVNVDELTMELYRQVNDAPNFQLGHQALALFPLAKLLKLNPAKASNDLKVELSKELDTNVFEKLEAKGPYLNAFYNPNFLLKSLMNDFKNLHNPLMKDAPKTMVEYSQPNTHKVLHVGHMRNLCMGNSLVKILRHTGYPVISATYPGDVGTHVAKCLWYVKKNNLSPEAGEDKGEWLGKIYTLANTLLEDEKGTDKEDQNRIELTAILKELHDGSGEYFDLWKETREWSLTLMKKAYGYADVEFDRWFFESEVDAPSLSFVQKLYDEGTLVKDDGAIGMDLSEDKLGFCLLIKSDGTGLYSTKDVELARLKFEEFKVQKNIYVVDNRQSYHFKQVFKVLEKIGFEQAKDCFHLAYEMVELSDGAMSSRKGNIVNLMDLIHNMEKTIRSRIVENAKNSDAQTWTEQEIDETAHMIADGAIKYGMLRFDNNRKIVFEMEEWLNLDGETGPYLQYVHARINSILGKAGHLNLREINEDVLTKPKEIQLLLKLNSFNDIILRSAETMKTLHLTGYLFELGKLYNSFYAEHSVLNAQTEELKTARLNLCLMTKETMKKGLELLGIKAPNKM
ncbi:MAG: arginine--tRNA ligase [Bacteriovoracaceae bacterium]